MFIASPLPRPRIARPRVRWSSVNICWATIAGLRRIRSVTTEPTRMRSVAAPTAPIISSGSK